MMKYFIGILICLSGFFAQAQKDSTNHYFSIQSNQLIRQLLNFGGSSPALNNPYTLKYSFENPRHIGLNVGLGLDFDSFEDGDAFSKRETSISDFFIRIGIDKKSYLTERFLLEVGADVLYQSQTNETTADFDFGGNGSSSSSTTINKSSGLGFGPRLSLSFQINDKILIGTEASYYFKSINRDLDFEDDQDSSNDFSENFQSESLELAVPSVIYLTFKL